MLKIFNILFDNHFERVILQSPRHKRRGEMCKLGINRNTILCTTSKNQSKLKASHGELYR